ncbi:MAG: EamA family transporter [Pseudomonadota bacterium]
MTGRDLFFALLVVTIWGVSFSVVKVGLDELPPIFFVAIRFAIVVIPAVFFIPFPKTSIWNVIAVGVFIGVIKFGLLFIAMRADANASMASLILQAQVFFTIGLSVVLFKEKLSAEQLSGIVVAGIGFSVFFFGGGEAITILGLSLVLGAAAAWSVANIVMKRMRDVNLLGFMVWASAIPPIPLFAVSYFMETNDPFGLILTLSPKAWLSIAYMGYLSTLLAYALWGRLLNRLPASTVTPFALLIPVIGILTSNLFLSETLTMLEIAGTGAVMAGLCLCVAGKPVIAYLRSRSGLAGSA